MSTATVFISLSIALLSGLLLSRLAKLVNLPAVTAYLVAGILIGLPHTIISQAAGKDIGLFHLAQKVQQGLSALAQFSGICSQRLRVMVRR